MSAPVRRSQRLAQRHNADDSHYTPPPAPKLDASPHGFDGPRPTWLTEESDHFEMPEPPKGHAPRTHNLPPLSPRAVASMSSAPGLVGIGIQVVSPECTRSHQDTCVDLSTHMGSALSSSTTDQADSTTFVCRSPADAFQIPATPTLEPLENGKFPISEMPSPLGKLVDATHPDAKIPQRASNSVPSRKQTRLASLDGMPTDGGAVGLGLVALDNDENTFDDPVSKVMGNLERLSIKNEPKRKVLGERNLNALLPAQNVDAKAKPGKSMSLQDKSSKATTEKSHIPFSVLDENGKPMASKVPTKRYPSLPERKPRSSVAAPRLLHERASFAVHRSYSRPTSRASGLAQAPSRTSLKLR